MIKVKEEVKEWKEWTQRVPFYFHAGKRRSESDHLCSVFSLFLPPIRSFPLWQFIVLIMSNHNHKGLKYQFLELQLQLNLWKCIQLFPNSNEKWFLIWLEIFASDPAPSIFLLKERSPIVPDMCNGLWSIRLSFWPPSHRNQLLAKRS